MRIQVEVKPSSKKIGVEKISEACFRVRVSEPATEGKANQAVAEALADYFGLPKSSVVLVHGEKSKKKVFQVPG